MTQQPDAPNPDAPGGSTPPSSSPGPGGGASIHDAATVVVVRPHDDGAQILMLKRSAKSPFMPSTLVFPGGRLDTADGPVDDDATWETAARRECLEEANLALHDVRLRWFDTWLTPSAEPRRRYLARFYLALVDAHVGHDTRADGHETEDERWATVSAHLRGWDAGTIDLPPPTLSILLRLRDVGSDLDALTELDAREPILPKYVPMDGRHVIVMPHDREYSALPGDGLPCPSHRLHGLPHRFVRDEARWRPL